MNADYKARLSAISNFVLVMFELDTMVQPKESEVSRLLSSLLSTTHPFSLLPQWFGFYKEGQDKQVYTLYDSAIWTKVYYNNNVL